MQEETQDPKDRHGHNFGKTNTNKNDNTRLIARINKSQKKNWIITITKKSRPREIHNYTNIYKKVIILTNNFV